MGNFDATIRLKMWKEYAASIGATENTDAMGAKLTAMDERTHNVYAARQHIVGQILTLHCPRPNSKQAFLDFDGCFALKCHLSRYCFCTWCPKDCGNSVP